MAELRGITFDFKGTLEHMYVPIQGIRDGLVQLRDERIPVGIVSSGYEAEVKSFLIENGVETLVEPMAIFGRDSVRTYLEEQCKVRRRNFIGKALRGPTDPIIEIVPVQRKTPPKPNSMSMEYLLEQAWHLQPDEVVHVGDDEISDQNYARNANVGFVLVNQFMAVKSLPELIIEAKALVGSNTQQTTGGIDG